jgi:hypothetical protein
MVAFWTEELTLTIKEVEDYAAATGLPQGEEARAKYNAYAGQRYLCDVDLFDDGGISSGSQVKLVRITQHINIDKVNPKGSQTCRAMMIRDEGPISYCIGYTGYSIDFYTNGIPSKEWKNAKPTPRLVILA